MFALLFAAGTAAPPFRQEGGAQILAEVLKRAAAYCRLFSTASLNYVCVEDLRETVYIF